MSNSIVSSMITTSATSLTPPPQPDVKRYSLVKWLENSQFDAQNEWLGRLTSVPHTNIIDFDSEELKAGIEINVIRNNGEIWRAQVIIPKTSSNTIDLPPSSYKKIRTKAMGTTGSKLACELEQMELGGSEHNSDTGCSNDHSPSQQQSQPSTAVDFEPTDTADKQTGSSDAQNQLFVLTSAASSLSPEQTVVRHHSPTGSHIIGKADPDHNQSNQEEVHDQIGAVEKNSAFSDNEQKNRNELHQHEMKSAQCDLKTSDLSKVTHHNNHNNHNNHNSNNSVSSNQKEWQFLQTAINEAGLTDFYQTYNDLANNSTTLTAPNNNNINCTHHLSMTKANSNGHQHHQHQSSSFNSSLSNSPNPHQQLNPHQNHNQHQAPQPTSQLVTVSDLNIETILQMQCELLDQQKELKTIELETMDHLRQLHQNITKLAGKFESFENSLQTSNGVGGQYVMGSNNNNHMQDTMGHVGANGGLRAAKNVFNKFNSTIGQQLKLADNELLKELYNVPSLNPTPSHLNLNHNHSNLNPNNNPSININNVPNLNQATTTVCLFSPSTLIQTQQQQSQPAYATKTLIDLNESNNSGYLETSCCSSTSSSLNSHEPGNANKLPQIQQKQTPKVHGIQTQIALNRFLRESVKQKMGCDFLISHAVSDIPMAIMRAIKKEAFDKYLPHDRRPIKAWGLAMASLRCHKRDLVKNRNKQLAAAEAANAIAFAPAPTKQVQSQPTGQTVTPLVATVGQTTNL